MSAEVWVGMVEVRQLPGGDHSVLLSGKGAYTWIACWAKDVHSYKKKVSEVMTHYGLFVVNVEREMTYEDGERRGLLSEEVIELCQDAAKDENFCIFGTLHNYMTDT
jgi:hypothetical protein